jgi:glycine/D-amino acid oxidase-like deaminating enzyme
MPGIDTTGLVAAAWEPESGYADPYLTVTAFARAARREGAQIFQNTRVTGVRFAADKVQGVDTTNGGFDAPVIINAAGAWGAQVAKWAGVDAPIDPCRVQVAFFRRPQGAEAPHPVVADFIEAVYYRSETGALTLAGLIDPSEADALVDPDHFDEQLAPDFVLEAGERIVTRYPLMEQSQSMGGYASLYAITPDWHPIVDEVPAGSGFYICSGFSGHGFKLGPAFGLMMADLVTRAPDPTFSARMFRLSRFAEGEPVRGQYEYSIVG